MGVTRTPARPPRAPARAKLAVLTRHTLSPTTAAAVGFEATARMARPAAVFRKKRTRRAMATVVIARTQIAWGVMVAPRTASGVSPERGGTAREFFPQVCFMAPRSAMDTP